jgi:hypothetical protein
VSDALQKAKDALRDWHGKHPDGGKLDPKTTTFGSRALFFGAVVIIEGCTRDNMDVPYILHVRFACDHRRMSFPVRLDQLTRIPVQSPEPKTVH